MDGNLSMQNSQQFYSEKEFNEAWDYAENQATNKTNTMSKNLSNYLHFYIGCDIIITDIDGQQFVDKVESVKKDNAGHRFSIYEFGDMPFEQHEEYYHDAQPLLRSLYDITDDELIELADKNQTNCLPYGWKEYGKYKVIRLDHPNKGVELNVLDKYALRITNNKALYFYDYTSPNSAYFVSESFDMVAYLLNMKFDLFGLIEAGIAIDKLLYDKKIHSGNEHQWQDDWDIDEQGNLNEEIN